MNSGPNGKNDRPAGVSMNAGGAATFFGTNYQVDYAVNRIMDLLTAHLCEPYKAHALQMESLIPADNRQIGWDFGLQPDEILVEVKGNPDSSEVIEWLKTVAAQAEHLPKAQFWFVYCTTRTPTLTDNLRTMVKIARRWSGQIENFKQQLARENIKNSQRILDALGPSAFDLLARIKVRAVNDESLQEDNLKDAGHLAGDRKAAELTDFLQSEIRRAAANRLTIRIVDLIKDLEFRGITIFAPPNIAQKSLPTRIATALFILQACPAKIHVAVVEHLQRGLPTSYVTLKNRVWDGFWKLESQSLGAQRVLCLLTPAPKGQPTFDANSRFAELKEAAA